MPPSLSSSRPSNPMRLITGSCTQIAVLSSKLSPRPNSISQMCLTNSTSIAMAKNAAICVHDPVINRIGLLGREELSEGGIGGRLYGESLGAALAVHILRHYGTSPRAPAIHKGGLASRPLKRVIEYINEHLQDELSLVELSRIAKLSPHHFATAFKASTGISPHSYVIERRIDRARDLLLQKEKTIPEIAVAVGFSSQSHLTANFRRTMGVTPRKFRESVG